MKLNPEYPDFQNFIKIDYQIYHNDNDDFDSIVEPRILDVDTQSIVKYYLEYEPLKNKYDELFDYCVDRIVQYNDVEFRNAWELELREFYYGKEVESIKFLNHEKIMHDLDKLVSKNSTEAIEYVLEKEYGYVLEGIKDFHWFVDVISRDDVNIINENHYNNLNERAVQKYKNYCLPKCIVIPFGYKKYRLIDGYHRYASCKDDKIKVIIGYG